MLKVVACQVATDINPFIAKHTILTILLASQGETAGA